VRSPAILDQTLPVLAFRGAYTPKLGFGAKTLTFLDGYCSTVQGLLDWFEVDLGFTELLFIQIDLCIMCVFVLYSHT